MLLVSVATISNLLLHSSVLSMFRKQDAFFQMRDDCVFEWLFSYVLVVSEIYLHSLWAHCQIMCVQMIFASTKDGSYKCDLIYQKWNQNVENLYTVQLFKDEMFQIIKLFGSWGTVLLWLVFEMLPPHQAPVLKPRFPNYSNLLQNCGTFQVRGLLSGSQWVLEGLWKF